MLFDVVAVVAGGDDADNDGDDGGDDDDDVFFLLCCFCLLLLFAGFAFVRCFCLLALLLFVRSGVVIYRWEFGLCGTAVESCKASRHPFHRESFES